MLNWRILRVAYFVILNLQIHYQVSSPTGYRIERLTGPIKMPKIFNHLNLYNKRHRERNGPHSRLWIRLHMQVEGPHKMNPDIKQCIYGLLFSLGHISLPPCWYISKSQIEVEQEGWTGGSWGQLYILDPLRRHRGMHACLWHSATGFICMSWAEGKWMADLRHHK